MRWYNMPYELLFSCSRWRSTFQRGRHERVPNGAQTRAHFFIRPEIRTSPTKGRPVTKTVQYRVRNPGTAIFLRTWLVQKRLRRLERLRLPLSSYRVKAPPLSQTTRPFISILLPVVRRIPPFGGGPAVGPLTPFYRLACKGLLKTRGRNACVVKFSP